MNTKLIAGAALSGLILAGGIAPMVSAQSVADATMLTEEQVIAIALLEVPGELVEVELEDHRKGQVYEVEIASVDGTEMEVIISAETGEVLKVEAEDEDCDREGREDDA